MEIQRADAGYRRRVIRTLCAAGMLLLGLLVGLRFWLGYVSTRMQPDDLPAALAILRLACFMLIAVCLAALGSHLLVRGNLIVRGRRFPPRDVRAVRDTPVREGDDAVRIGRLSRIGGLACVMVALLVAAGAWLLNAGF